MILCVRDMVGKLYFTKITVREMHFLSAITMSSLLVKIKTSKDRNNKIYIKCCFIEMIISKTV